MSTRANIVVKEGSDKLIFYQHSDGYPDGVIPMLRWFIDEINYGTIRPNVEQAAGWLIVYGRRRLDDILQSTDAYRLYGWKCGTVEPSIDIHGDIEYYYVVDIRYHKVTAYKVIKQPDKKMTELSSAYLKKIGEYR